MRVFMPVSNFGFSNSFNIPETLKKSDIDFIYSHLFDLKTPTQGRLWSRICQLPHIWKNYTDVEINSKAALKIDTLTDEQKAVILAVLHENPEKFQGHSYTEQFLNNIGLNTNFSLKSKELIERVIITGNREIIKKFLEIEKESQAALVELIDDIEIEKKETIFKSLYEAKQLDDSTVIRIITDISAISIFTLDTYKRVLPQLKLSHSDMATLLIFSKEQSKLEYFNEYILENFSDEDVTKISFHCQEQYINNAISQLQYGIYTEDNDKVSKWMNNLNEHLDGLELSKDQQIQLSILLLQKQCILPELDNYPWARILPEIQEHHNCISDNNLSFIRKIEYLSSLKENKYELIAHFINFHKISIEELMPYLTNHEWDLLAPHLRFADLRFLDDNKILFGLELIKKCPNLNILLINNNKFTELPVLPNLQYLNCSGTNVQEIRSYPNLQELHCYNCTSLQKIGSHPNLQELDCDSCISLQEIGPQPNMQTLRCTHCPSLQGIPSVPNNANIYSDNTPMTHFSKLNVEFKEFSNPLELLLRLGREYLLQGLPFPYVYYYEDGVLNEVIDVGGVSKDFVIRVIENLFKEQNGEVRGLLLKNRLPIDDESVDSKDGYCTLGKLFSLCYPPNSSFKTGAVFPPEYSRQIYNCIASSRNPEQPLSDEWLISGYLALMGAPVALFTLLNADSSALDLTEEQWTNIGYFVDSIGETVVNQAYFENQENKDKLRSEYLALAKSSPNIESLRALAMIASSMKESLGTAEWNMLCLSGGEALQVRIEGVLNVDALLKKLTWDVESTVSFEKETKTKEILTKWINANPEKLTKFVRAVTSNKTLGPDPIIIQLFDRDSDRLPVVHTCFSTLELSANYPSLEHLDEKLNWLLTEGMAATGFQEK